MPKQYGKQGMIFGKCEECTKKKELTITLKYSATGERVISGLKKISKPGLRINVGYENLPRVLKGLGIAVISTSKGVMTDAKARSLHIGGEVIAYIW